MDTMTFTTLKPLARAALARGEKLWLEAHAIWISGGWAMIPIGITALAIGAQTTGMGLKLAALRWTAARERTWRRWIAHPAERRGAMGALLNEVDGGRTPADTAVLFEDLRIAHLQPFERDLRALRVWIGAAPLLGLLGTVTGMLKTFAALASGAGGERTMAMIAQGISEALVTTETGLVVGLTGLFLHYALARALARKLAALAHVETVVKQMRHRHALQSARERPRCDRGATTAAPAMAAAR